MKINLIFVGKVFSATLYNMIQQRRRAKHVTVGTHTTPFYISLQCKPSSPDLSPLNTNSFK